VRRLLLTSLSALALLLAACGDDEPTTQSAATSTADTTATAAAGAKPHGEMRADGIGPLALGASPDDAVAAFGEPDGEEEFPSGCYADPDAAPTRQLTYELGDGKLGLDFNADTYELTYYFTTSASLATERGERVGDTWDQLTASWGAALDPIELGTEKPTPNAGIYKVGPEGENQLVFDLSAREVRRISGGTLQICE
jgi:hypothetical protein